jgi:hypothetical protein
LKLKGDFLMHGVVLQNRVFQVPATAFLTPPPAWPYTQPSCWRP